MNNNTFRVSIVRGKNRIISRDSTGTYNVNDVKALQCITLSSEL